METLFTYFFMLNTDIMAFETGKKLKRQFLSWSKRTQKAPMVGKDTDYLTENCQKITTSKNERTVHPIPSSLIELNEEDKQKLINVIFEWNLKSVGLA